MPKIAVLASFNMDLVMRVERRPEAGETLQGEFAMHLGGKGFNQAIAARRLGADVVVAGRVGDDQFGRMFLDALDAEGIDRRAVVVDKTTSTGVASIIVEPDGTNSIIQAPRANRKVVRADWSTGFGARQYDEDYPAVSTFFDDVDVGLACLETNQRAVDGFFQDMHFAFKSERILNAAPAGDISTALYYTSRIVVNDLEAQYLTGVPVDSLDAALQAARTIPRAAVVTLGGGGAIAVSPGTRMHAPAFDVPVIDTTGAGDAFTAALAVRIARGVDFADALRFANAAGALACTREGAAPSMPYRNDVEELLRIGATRS